MRSKAAIGNHPIHPMLVAIPIGAFVLSMVGDVLHMARPEDPYWYGFSYSCIGIGILFAVLAGVAGAIDYVSVRMSAAAFRTATKHAVLNVAMLGCYLVSFLLRRNDAAFDSRRWPLAFGFALLAFVLLGVSGWLGGKLAYEHRVGVVELPEAAVLASEAPGTKRVAS
jgi:uncharacterized membrane protein